jgi:hypothetical protein
MKILYTLKSVKPYNWSKTDTRHTFKLELYNEYANCLNGLTDKYLTGLAVNIINECLNVYKVPELFSVKYNKRNYKSVEIAIPKSKINAFIKLCESYGNSPEYTLEALLSYFIHRNQLSKTPAKK